MKNRIILAALLLFCSGIYAQSPLPRGFAPGEEAQMREYIASFQNRSAACAVETPSDMSFRSIAEWEELQAVAITWASFSTILTEIVRHAREEVEVIIICNNEVSVQNTLTQANVDWSSNVTFIETSFNSIWIRDYGPNSVYLNDVETRASIDWIYNRPRPLDDKVPEAIADYLGIDNYCTTVAPNDLVHTGGNYMSDGMGTGFSSDLVLEENGNGNNWGSSNHSPEEVDQLMNTYTGINNYVKMEALPFDLIHHIDMHMKLLDEERLIIGQYPEGVADGPQIEANIQFILNNFTTPYGNPYEIVRIPMPPEGGQYPNTGGDYRTYANALFVNKTILVPTYQELYDTTALRIWRENMPGYNVVGINCNAIIPLSGALHCITKEVGIAEPLWITHEKVKENCMDEPIFVEAQIKHTTGIAEAKVFYRAANQTDWQSVDLSASSQAGYWEGEIPTQTEEGAIEYYIEASANDGKVINRPMTSPEGAWTFPVINCMPVSTNELEESDKMAAIFPNPATAITCIPVQCAGKTTGTIEMHDVLGRKVETIFSGQFPAGASKYFINASAYPAGTYWLSFKTEAGQQTQKLVIQ